MDSDGHESLSSIIYKRYKKGISFASMLITEIYSEDILMEHGSV